jgi:hypothetical protein
MSDITITLCDPQTGQSESMPVADTMIVNEVIEFSKALLGVSGNLVLVKDGKELTNPSQSLMEAGVATGDLLVVMDPTARHQASAPDPPPAGGGLDFSSLLGSSSNAAAAAAPAAGGGLNFSNLLASTTVDDNPTPVYYAGMSFLDALE